MWVSEWTSEGEDRSSADSQNCWMLPGRRVRFWEGRVLRKALVITFSFEPAFVPTRTHFYRGTGCDRKCYKIKNATATWRWFQLLQIEYFFKVIKSVQVRAWQLSGGWGAEAVATWAKTSVIGSGFLTPDPAHGPFLISLFCRIQNRGLKETETETSVTDAEIEPAMWKNHRLRLFWAFICKILSAQPFTLNWKDSNGPERPTLIQLQDEIAAS